MSYFPSFDDNSRVWIYQSNRQLLPEEVKQIESILTDFTKGWTSHNQQLRAGASVLHNHFIVLIVDESQASTGGCSIDSSVSIIKKIGAEFGIDFFNRMNFAYQDNDQVKIASKEEFGLLFQEGKIDNNTPVFNNLVTNKSSFEKAWITRLQDSWHRRFV